MLTSTLPRWEGDTEPRFVLDLARSLSPDAQVELLAPHTPGAARTETLEGIPVQRYRYWIPRWQAAAYQGGMTQRLRQNRWRALQLPFFFLAQTWTIARRLRQKPAVDVIHAHWLIPQGLAALIARRITRRTDIPVVCTSHGGDLFGLRGGLMTRLKRWIIGQCEATTVVSHAMADAVKELRPECDPAVIPMGTDLQTRFTPGDDSTLRDPNHLIVVGRLVEKKGIRFLLEALARFEPQDRPTLDIVGDGPLRADLETLAQRLGLTNHVNFLGARPHSELPEHYRRAAIAVFPFVQAADGDQEGFGLVMVEAMGCGCAVIASDLPAVRDVLPDNAVGITVPPAAPSSLADAVAHLLGEPHARHSIASAGRHHALERFDWSASAEAFARVYAGLEARRIGQRHNHTPA